MHFRNPRRSIPSRWWSNRIASWFFCSIFFLSILPKPGPVRSGSTVQNPQPKLLFQEKLFWSVGNKTILRWFTLIWVSDERSFSGSFEELAMPLFDPLYNFAHWLTQNREEAEDLVQETYAKALKGFSSFQLGTNFRAWMYRILRNTFLTSRTGLRATSTIPLDSEEDGPELAVEKETPETTL